MGFCADVEGEAFARNRRGVVAMSGKSKADLMCEEFLRKLPHMIKPIRPKAEVVLLPVRVNEPPKQLSDAELWRRQQIIDACWAQQVEARQEQEAEMQRRCFHRWPVDSDWNLR
jgi:hypothetical protein